ncbi:MAG: alpha/beta fold hydrolase [Candidatus Aenigmarchaeota archaeon]|nr:alpha/beta fold hydrolase [Candidatus Aenigmarchaeota archaeon]
MVDKMSELKISYRVKEQKIVGILHVPDKKTGSGIILAHGITVNKDEDGAFINLARELSKNGYTVLRFDFRGHGESDLKSKDFTITTGLEDLAASVNFMRDSGISKMGLLGASFSGGTSSVFAGKNPNAVNCLTLWNPLIDYNEVFNPRLPWAVKNFTLENFKLLQTQGYFELGEKRFIVGKKLFEEMKKVQPWQYFEKIDCPTLIAHGNKDSYVSYQNALRYSSLLKALNKFETIENAEHGFHKPWEQRRAIELTVNWFNRWLK